MRHTPLFWVVLGLLAAVLWTHPRPCAGQEATAPRQAGTVALTGRTNQARPARQPRQEAANTTRTKPLDGLLRPLRRALRGRGDRRPASQTTNAKVPAPAPLLPHPSSLFGNGGDVRATPAAQTAERAAPVADALPSHSAKGRGTVATNDGWHVRRPHTETGQEADPTPSQEARLPELYASQRVDEINPLETGVKKDGLPLPEVLPLPEAKYQPRSWQQQQVAWKASGLKHVPLYFEDAPLERYGHSLGLFQPVWSTGQFYAQMLLLPYQMEMEPPLESVYSLGFARPGDPVPRLWYQFPISPSGALSETAFWASNIASLP